MNRRLSISSFRPHVPPHSEKARLLLSLGREEWSVNSATAIPYTSHSGLGAIKGGHAIENRLLPFSGSPVGDVITAGLNSSLHGAFAHTGKLCQHGSAVALGTATAISPTHILVARHCLNQFRLSDLHFRIDGLEREMRLVEDGAMHDYDYAVLAVVGHSFESFVRLDPVQPPVSGFAVGYSPDDQLILHAEDKSLSSSFFLKEVNYLPTEAGMSGAVYRDMVTGNGFALHIKRCVGGLFEGQNTGILVSELLQSLPANSGLFQLCRGEYDIPSIEMPHHFSCFSTAMADEIDQGDELNRIRGKFKNDLKHGYFLTNHMKVGAAAMSRASHAVSLDFDTVVPLIIEIMAPNLLSARAKIDAIRNNARMTKNPMTLLIALNQEVSAFSGSAATFKRLGQEAQTVSELMTQYNLPGACIPFVWIPTGAPSQKSEVKKTENRGYVFPFLEARSLLVLHPEVEVIHAKMLERMRPFGCAPVVRWMDADVVSDILLLPMGVCEVEEKYQLMLEKVSRSENSLASGGYSWQTTQIKDRLKALKLIGLKRITAREDEIANTMIRVIETINAWEAEVRTQLLTTLGHRGIYWPEPNLYSSFAIRQNGAVSAYDWAVKYPSESQQQESTYLVSAAAITDGIFEPALITTKPIKETHADWNTFFERMVPLIRAQTTDAEAVKAAVKMIRQTHLNTDNVESIHAWHKTYIAKEVWAASAEVCLSKCVDTLLAFISSP